MNGPSQPRKPALDLTKLPISVLQPEPTPYQFAHARSRGFTRRKLLQGLVSACVVGTRVLPVISPISISLHLVQRRSSRRAENSISDEDIVQMEASLRDWQLGEKVLQWRGHNRKGLAALASGLKEGYENRVSGTTYEHLQQLLEKRDNYSPTVAASVCTIVARCALFLGRYPESSRYFAWAAKDGDASGDRVCEGKALVKLMVRGYSEGEFSLVRARWEQIEDLFGPNGAATNEEQELYRHGNIVRLHLLAHEQRDSRKPAKKTLDALGAELARMEGDNPVTAWIRVPPLVGQLAGLGFAEEAVRLADSALARAGEASAIGRFASAQKEKRGCEYLTLMTARAGACLVRSRQVPPSKSSAEERQGWLREADLSLKEPLRYLDRPFASAFRATAVSYGSLIRRDLGIPTAEVDPLQQGNWNVTYSPSIPG